MPDCATGDGWASRLEDSLLHGTIPVIIQDGVVEKFYGVVDFAAISVRIAEADIERVCNLECRRACWDVLVGWLVGPEVAFLCMNPPG